MSHFTVLVVGDDVDAQLAPYHEFECTGHNDEYVQELDKLEDYTAEYDAERLTQVRGPDGMLSWPSDPQFYRDPTLAEQAQVPHMLGTGCGHGLSWSSRDWGDGRGHRAKVYALPPGYTEVEVPAAEVMSFAEWLDEWHGTKVVPHGEPVDIDGEHQFGYAQLDEHGDVVRVVRRTNLNRKWDWYQIGGRWTGFFKLKHAARGATGKPGLMTTPALPGLRGPGAQGRHRLGVDAEGGS